MNKSKVVEEMFNRKSTELQPLYIKLIYQYIKTWNVLTKPTEQFKGLCSIDDCINYLFDNLEKKHGKLVFSRYVFYLTALTNGITETELEDVMSIDNDALFNLAEFHKLPNLRFPVGVLARYKFDLIDYISEKQSDGTTVLSWWVFLLWLCSSFLKIINYVNVNVLKNRYHRKFKEVASLRYLKCENNQNIFENIVDYFTEKWNKEKKSFQYNERLGNYSKLKIIETQRHKRSRKF